MVNHDDDKQIAAASLLALIGSTAADSNKKCELKLEEVEERKMKVSQIGDNDKTPYQPQKPSITTARQESSRQKSLGPFSFLHEDHKNYSDSDSSNHQEYDENESQGCESSTIPSLRRSSTDSSTVEQQFEFQQQPDQCTSSSLSRPLTILKQPPAISTNIKAIARNDDKVEEEQQEHMPVILMRMLTDKAYKNTIFFLPDGKTFAITNTFRFTVEILWNYCQFITFSDFLSALDRWGFTHTILENDQHLFSHPLFLKDDWVSLHVFLRAAESRQASEAFCSSRSRPSRKRKNNDNINNDGIHAQMIKTPKIRQNESTHGSLQLPSSLSTNNHHQELNAVSRQIETELAVLNSMNNQSALSLNAINDATLSASSLYAPDAPLVPITTMDNSYAEMSTVDVNHATKDIVTKAIDCLLFDENHTREMIAQRGQELQKRRFSLNNHVFQTISNGLSMPGNLPLAAAATSHFPFNPLPHSK
jgi:hypothetical protein